MGGWAAGLLTLALAGNPLPKSELTVIYRQGDLSGGAPVQHVLGAAELGKYKVFAGFTRPGTDSPDLPLQPQEAFAGISTGGLTLAVKDGDASMMSMQYDGRLGGTLSVMTVGETTDLTPLYTSDVRGHAELRWQATPGLGLRAFGGKQSTPELRRKTEDIVKPWMPERLLGHETLYDRDLGIRSPQDGLGAGVRYARGAQTYDIAITGGEQLDIAGEPAGFTGLDASFGHDGNAFDGDAAIAVRQHDLFHKEYESQVRFEGRWSIGRGGAGLGFYSRGMHPDIMETVLASAVRGGGVDITLPVGERRITCFGLYDEDTGMALNTVRAGVSLGSGTGRYTIGVRQDSMPSRRFDDRSIGYFVGVKRDSARFSIDATIGTQPDARSGDDGLYGDITMTVRR